MPELEYVLLVLMVKTKLPPRDTLSHYTLWNPDGERMRTYSGLEDEKHLIKSIKIAMPSLVEAIFQIEALHDMVPLGLSFETHCKQLRTKMEAMVLGIVHAKKNVSPEVFASHLRFYYDPIKVDYDREYIGPGAVEMPMFVFDHLLWSSDCHDEHYTKFKEGYLPYNVSFIRDVYHRFERKRSLVSKVHEQLCESPSPDSYRAARAVIDLCAVLKSFRMPRKKLAESAYNHSEENLRNKGSGGYSTDILNTIIDLQNEKINSLQEAVSSFLVSVS